MSNSLETHQPNMKTQTWGPPMWKTLHAVSFGYPENPGPSCKNAYKDFFASLKSVLPCSPCRRHYARMISTPTCKLSNKIFRNRNTLTRWLVRLHNTVNRKMRKPCLSYKVVCEQYAAWKVKKRGRPIKK